MKVSMYTFVRDGLFNDYHAKAMLSHHAKFVDELIVNEGYSSDGTYEAIRDIHPNIRIIRSHWGETWSSANWPCEFKNMARKACTGDWCILMDCDEIIPDSEFLTLRDKLSNAGDNFFASRILNFYGNYRVLHTNARKLGWPEQKSIIHPNMSKYQVWGDGANVGINGKGHDANLSQALVTVHHFGAVRHPGRLRHLWSLQGNAKRRTTFLRKLLLRVPFMYDFFPHRWDDPDILPDLEIYNGEIASIVASQPEEFTRDKMVLYDRLSTK